MNFIFKIFEEQKPVTSITRLPSVTARSSQSNSRSQTPIATPERKCSPYCNHRKSDLHPNRIVYKTKKQLQEEENHRFLLQTRIKCNQKNYFLI